MTRDVYFSKPRLFKSNTGRWCCDLVRSDMWRPVGSGRTMKEAYDDLLRAVRDAYAPAKVEFIYD